METLKRILAVLDLISLKLFGRWYRVTYYKPVEITRGLKMKYVFLKGFSAGFVYDNLNRYHKDYCVIAVERAKGYAKQKRKV